MRAKSGHSEATRMGYTCVTNEVDGRQLLEARRSHGLTTHRPKSDDSLRLENLTSKDRKTSVERIIHDNNIV